MLETKRVTSYGKRSKRIVYVSDERRAPHVSPFASLRSSRENTTSNSPPSGRKALSFHPRKVHGLSTSPRGSPKSGNVLRMASKKPPTSSTAYTPQRRPLGLKTAHMHDSPSVVFLSQKPAQTPTAKSAKFAPFVDEDVTAAVKRPKKVTKDRVASSNIRQVVAVAEDESVELVRPSRKRAQKRAIVVTDDEDDEDEKPTLRQTRRGARAHPIVVSSDDSSDYPETVPTPQPHTLRSRKTPPDPGSEGPRPPPKASARRLQTEISLLKQPVQPRPVRGHIRPSAPAQEAPVRPPSPRRSHRNVLAPVQDHTQQPPPSIAELELSFAALDLSAEVQPKARRPQTRKASSTHQYLAPLLAECGQTEPRCFNTFIETFPFDDIHHPSVGLAFRKIGEASYSEVFAIGDVVLKIVPLRNESSSAAHGDSGLDLSMDLPQESETKDVLQEMVVTRAMGEMCPGFVKLLRTYIVTGEYPSLLLSLWDEFNHVKNSENIRPDIFPLTQAYALLVLPHGGPDLEAYTFSVKMGWRQACSIFWQTAKALATAEELVSFEHRDLHWGQILVKGAAPGRKVTSKRRVGDAEEAIPMDHPSNGVTATIIDLGFARMDAGDGHGVHWTPFDELIFEGEGDYQFDVYRLMQRHHGDTWDQYRPLTNIMWLHYLAVKLLRSKRLRPPGKRNAPAVAGEFGEKECHECLVEVEQLLGSCISQAKSKKGRGGTKGVICKAGDIVSFARSRSWVE